VEWTRFGVDSETAALDEPPARRARSIVPPLKIVVSSVRLRVSPSPRWGRAHRSHRTADSVLRRRTRRARCPASERGGVPSAHHRGRAWGGARNSGECEVAGSRRRASALRPREECSSSIKRLACLGTPRLRRGRSPRAAFPVLSGCVPGDGMFQLGCCGLVPG
jgi:hypothetical protein